MESADLNYQAQLLLTQPLFTKRMINCDYFRFFEYEIYYDTDKFLTGHCALKARASLCIIDLNSGNSNLSVYVATINVVSIYVVKLFVPSNYNLRRTSPTA